MGASIVVPEKGWLWEGGTVGTLGVGSCSIPLPGSWFDGCVHGDNHLVLHLRCGAFLHVLFQYKVSTYPGYV